MKRPYSCPKLVFESYQLDAAIAIKCSMPIGNTMYQCSADVSGGGKYGYGYGGEAFNTLNCTAYQFVGDTPDHDYEWYCYHEAVALFEMFLNS